MLSSSSQLRSPATNVVYAQTRLTLLSKHECQAYTRVHRGGETDAFANQHIYYHFVF